MIQITATTKELDNTNGGGGLEIIIPGAMGNPTETIDCPVFIEEYKGQLRVVIWDGNEEPTIIPIKNYTPKLCP